MAAAADFTEDDEVFTKCDPTKCICYTNTSCNTVFHSHLTCYGLTSGITDHHTLFHVQKDTSDDSKNLMNILILWQYIQ